MTSSLSQHIAGRIKAEKPDCFGNRAAFLAVREDIKDALDDGWPIKTICETLLKERKIALKSDLDWLVRDPKLPVVNSLQRTALQRQR